MKQGSVHYFQVIVFVAAIALLTCGGYIHAKAQLAQWLISSAWTQATNDKVQIKPWPWADTWPVARLEVPRYKIDHYVLAGSTGESLAFGPGHVFASAAPTEQGNTIIAAHRDTHFEFLQDVQQGDVITIHNTKGKRRDYIVQDMKVVDKNDVAWLDNAAYSHQLTLVTCYPFNAIQVGGRLRYVVRAVSREDISA
ncbi:MAG: class GN sortase [Methylophaga sp.]|nr:class GN sortase [Methylophaga sp.]